MPQISDQRLLELAYDNLQPFLRRLADGAPDSRFVEFGGVCAAVVPSVPARSIVNSACFDRSAPTDLLDGLESFKRAYAEAGVDAWGVWLLDGEIELESALADAGLRLDSRPAAMAGEIAAMELSTNGEAEIDDSWSPATIALLNARAYGLPDDEFHGALAGLPSGDDIFMVTTREKGEPAACALMQMLDNGDCGVFFVATLPDHRGRGLGRAVMAEGLRRARERGCVTSSLQSSEKGHALYLKLGYRDLGRQVNLWEYRSPAE